MRKRILCAVFAAFTALSLTACGEPSAAQPNASAPDSQQQAEPQPPELTGTWKQVNSNSETSYQTAVIQGETIEVYWTDESTDTDSLYWAGSFSAPTTTDEPYTWDSKNDTQKTSSALLASGDDTKTFTYENGQISYSVSAMGTTQTVKLERTGDAPVANTPTEPTAAADTGTIGKYDVKIGDCAFGEDYEGNKMIVVNYDFTNNSEDTVMPLMALEGKAFQDGVQLELAIAFDSSVYDAGIEQKELKPGASLSGCQKAYVLSSESPVEFEFGELFGSPVLTKTFEVK